VAVGVALVNLALMVVAVVLVVLKPQVVFQSLAALLTQLQ
jgi:hypothetical protein